VVNIGSASTVSYKHTPANGNLMARSMSLPISP
jgi:hypothetical protein